MKITKTGFIIILMIALPLLVFLSPVAAQGKKFPHSVKLLTTDNKTINSQSFANNGKPVIILYWMTTCKPCIKEHNAITSLIVKWKKDTGVRIISITPQKKKFLPKVKAMIDKYGWKHEFYIDYSKRLRQKLLGNWHGVPQSFVFDRDFKIQYHGFGFKKSHITKLETLIYKLAAAAGSGQK